MPPAHPSGRACAGSPPLRVLHPTHSRPTAAAARAPSVPGTPGAAQPSPTRRARLGHNSDTMVDELRQLGRVVRRRCASSWVDCRHEGRDMTRGELAVCARRWGCKRCAQAPRLRGDRRSRLCGFESHANLCASVGAQRPRERLFGVARHMCMHMYMLSLIHI
eukprot:2946950-Prymnesium_polylepis.1